jgi:hypothetical protein
LYRDGHRDCGPLGDYNTTNVRSFECVKEILGMKTLIDGLPPEIAQAIHADWRKNEADYWAVRPDLLNQYRNQWVGFAGGQVLVAGASAVEVLHAARKLAPHAFVVCVGREFEPSRIRRATFPYDTSYPVEPLPVLQVNQLDALFRGPAREVVINP